MDCADYWTVLYFQKDELAEAEDDSETAAKPGMNTWVTAFYFRLTVSDHFDSGVTSSEKLNFHGIFFFDDSVFKTWPQVQKYYRSISDVVRSAVI